VDFNLFQVLGRLLYLKGKNKHFRELFRQEEFLTESAANVAEVMHMIPTAKMVESSTIPLLNL
jgi:hypothetical protein